MLLNRYGGNIEYVMSLFYKEAEDLVVEAAEKEFENKLYQIYVTNLPYMDESNYISFEEFMESMKPSTKLTEEEMLKDIENIRKGATNGI